MREYVAERVGRQYLVPLLGVYDRLCREVFETLPDQFIIKANHGCKWHKVVRDKSELDLTATVEHFNRLMKKTFGKKLGEFHYSLIQPKILIEELLTDEPGALCNYHLFCYNSSKGFDYAISAELLEGRRAGHFDKNWNLWEWCGEFSTEEKEKYLNPENFDEMLQVAKTLSADFDFVRIDLYNIEGRVYFSEITCTPAAGLVPVENEFRAARRADMWELAFDNERLYAKPKGLFGMESVMRRMAERRIVRRAVTPRPRV